MSEPESKNLAQPEERSDTVAFAEELSGQPAKKSGGVSAAIAWLALLLVLVLAGAAAWVLREGQARETAMTDRLTALEAATGQKQANLDALTNRWNKQLNSGVDGVKAALDEQLAKLAGELKSVEAQLADQQQELADQQKEMARFSVSDRESWLLAETGHLLRLANQRLVMAGDPVASLALLNGADAVLRDLNDPGLHAVRAAVAAEIAALRAMPKVDVQGIYLRLAALIEQADKLVIFQFKERESEPRQEASGDWRERLYHGYEAALSKLSDYIIIRRRDVPMQALMDPQWEGLVRQNLRMLLEQAQIALLSGNQALYEASLTQAQQWLLHFQDADPVAAKAIGSQIKQLSTLTIQVPQPDISRSQQALQAAIEKRAQTGGEQ
ncbi:Protein HemX [Halioglobus japonicus]|nr:Protein HemX [Halioglobus japonicus]